MPGDLLTISEAASRLGVSDRRARSLVEHQQLPAEKVGRQWLIHASGVGRARLGRQDRGRPIRPSTAWAAIENLSNLRWDEVDTDVVRRRLLPRARQVDMYVHPGMLKHVMTKSVRGGRDAAAKYKLPVDEGIQHDVYVKESELDPLIRKSGAQVVSDGANVRFHVVPDEVWPFKRLERAVSLWVVWLDLADRDDRAADTVLERLVGGRRRD